MANLKKCTIILQAIEANRQPRRNPYIPKQETLIYNLLQLPTKTQKLNPVHPNLTSYADRVKTKPSLDVRQL